MPRLVLISFLKRKWLHQYSGTRINWPRTFFSGVQNAWTFCLLGKNAVDFTPGIRSGPFSPPIKSPLYYLEWNVRTICLENEAVIFSAVQEYVAEMHSRIFPLSCIYIIVVTEKFVGKTAIISKIYITIVVKTPKNLPKLSDSESIWKGLICPV